jgi:hypothetical protein
LALIDDIVSMLIDSDTKTARNIIAIIIVTPRRLRPILL